MSARALVRSVSAGFAAALGQVPGAPAIDLDLARRQHAAYVEALQALGVSVTALPAAPDLPDCCFIEDTAVVAAGHALITRPGAPERRGEPTAVAAALRDHLPLHAVAAPATVDGGDVLRIGARFVVGRSERTNEAGVEALRATFGPLGFEVVSHPVRGQLHLKCHATSPLPGLVVMAPDALPAHLLEDVDTVVTVPAAEAYAANVVGHDGAVIVAAGYPATAAAVRAAGVRVHVIDVSQFALADGSLTCLSVFY